MDTQRGTPGPRRVGRYELLRELARGGMGVVYLARDPQLEREVALKVLLEQPGAGPEAQARFQREAQACASLHHAGIVRVLDYGWARGYAFLVMDLIQGEALDRRLARSGPLEPKEAAGVVAAVARALSEAHRSGVLHRDLKPSNIIASTSGRPVLTDFGLAIPTHPTDRRLTASGEVIGTPAFMPPEQARGGRDQVDERADVYSLGATLFTLVTGREPFVGPPLQVLLAVIEQPTPDPRALRPDLDRGLAEICLRCTARDPAERYPSAAALAEALEDYLADEPAPARGIPPAIAAVVLGVSVLLALIAGALLARRGEEPKPPATPTTAPTTTPTSPAPSVDPSPESTPEPTPDPTPQTDALRAAKEALEEAQRARWLGEQARKAELARHALSLIPTELRSRRADHLRGHAFRILLLPEKAIDVLKRALRGSPRATDGFDPHVCRTELAHAYLDLGRWRVAFQLLKRVVNADPTCVEAWRALGRLHTGLPEWPKTVRAYTEAIALDPSQSADWLGRSVAYRSQRQYDRAIADLKKALELRRNDDPRDQRRARLHYTLGMTWGARGKDAYFAKEPLSRVRSHYEQAQAALARALELAKQAPGYRGRQPEIQKWLKQVTDQLGVIRRAEKRR